MKSRLTSLFFDNILPPQYSSLSENNKSKNGLFMRKWRVYEGNKYVIKGRIVSTSRYQRVVLKKLCISVTVTDKVASW